MADRPHSLVLACGALIRASACNERERFSRGDWRALADSNHDLRIKCPPLCAIKLSAPSGSLKTIARPRMIEGKA